MPRFMIESSHASETPSEPMSMACVRAIDAAAAQGSHYLTRVQFGCEDGVHKSWIFIDAEDEEGARRMVPPVGRETAVIVRVRQYTPDQLRSVHYNTPMRERG